MKRMGITRIANVTGLDRIGIPVVMVTRPNSRSVAVSQGKGIDLDAAKASALMESVETWHAEHIDVPVLYGTRDDLGQNRRLVDPNVLPQINGTKYHKLLRILWVEGVELIDQRPIWLPHEMVHADYTAPSPPGQGCFPCSTNGLASGNHLLEAQNHAICEVIERDATTLLHYLPIAARQARLLELASVDDGECCALLQHLEQADLEMTLWDATSNIGVPAFYGLLINRESGQLEHIGAGAGCHPNKAIALSRTITEAVQTRLTYISGARDDLLSAEFVDGGLQEKNIAAREFIGTEKPARKYGDIGEFDAGSIDEDFNWLLGQLQSVGIKQVIRVDLTKPDIGIPVVRVVIPGVEAPHDDDDFLPGPRVVNIGGGS